MSLFQLADKFSDKLTKVALDTPEQDFYWTLRSHLRMAIQNLRSDAAWLRLRHLGDSRLYHETVALEDLIRDMAGEINPNHPYEGVRKIVSFLNSSKRTLMEMHKNLLGDMHKTPSNIPKYAAQGIPTLLSAAKYAEEYMAANPVTVEKTLPSVGIPHPSQEVMTNPSVPMAKKQLEDEITEMQVLRPTA